jgi:hypothetical protein
MTQDEIIEMAKEAGWHDDLLGVSFVLPMLKTFAKLVAAKEREACAKVCDKLPDSIYVCMDENSIRTDAIIECIDAIRARGEA